MMNDVTIRQPGLPLWRHIAQVIGDEIGAGRMEPGAPIPPEHELMARFDVSRHTVRQAMARLRELGMIDVSQGRGAYVRKEVLQHTITERTRFAKNVREQGLLPHNKFLGGEKTAATAEIARLLDISVKDPVWHMTVVSFADSVPISVGRLFHPAKRFPDMLRKRRINPDMIDVYAQYGITDFVRRSTWVSTRMPSEMEAQLLEIDVVDPVLVSQKIDVDADARPIEYNETLFSGRHVRLHFQTSEPQQGGNADHEPPNLPGSVLDGP